MSGNPAIFYPSLQAQAHAIVAAGIVPTIILVIALLVIVVVVVKTR